MRRSTKLFLALKDSENIFVLDLIHPCKHGEAAIVNIILFFSVLRSEYVSSVYILSLEGNDPCLAYTVLLLPTESEKELLTGPGRFLILISIILCILTKHGTVTESCHSYSRKYFIVKFSSSYLVISNLVCFLYVR